ncbi:MAG: QacE family quaternary ammonium compound efflux SMR transporter, partial [Myxococcales bacterium]|nr:QacE family quaternary ammonium compound efflux SMR transporter [Myxococcales bacterium]
LLLGALWFRESAGPARLLGALLTVAGVVLVSLA